VAQATTDVCQRVPTRKLTDSTQKPRLLPPGHELALSGSLLARWFQRQPRVILTVASTRRSRAEQGAKVQMTTLLTMRCAKPSISAIFIVFVA
jgi:hypothetical protein